MTAFDEVAASIGGRFAAGQIAALDTLLPRLYEQIAPRVADSRKDGAPMVVEIGFVNDPEFNAWAYSTPTIDLIGINFSVPFIFVGLFRALLSHPNVFPAVGSPEKMAAPPFVFQDSAARFPTTFFDWAAVPEVSEPGREAFAVSMAEGAVHYVLHHELAHLCNGHVDFMNRNFGLRRMAEVRPSEGEVEGLTSQTLEWDADQAAVQAMLASTLHADLYRDETGYQRWALPDRLPFGEIDDVIGFVAAMVIATHSFFDQPRDLHDPNLVLASHPPSMFRLSYNLGSIATVLQARAGMDFNYAIQKAMAGFGSFLQGLTQVLPGRMSISAADYARFDELNREYYPRYVRRWAEIRPELDKLKRGGNLAPAYDGNDL